MPKKNNFQDMHLTAIPTLKRNEKLESIRISGNLFDFVMQDGRESSLPPELEVLIFSYLLPEEMVMIGKVSKLWYVNSRNPQAETGFWKKRAVHHFPMAKLLETEKDQSNYDWFLRFANLYISTYGLNDKKRVVTTTDTRILSGFKEGVYGFVEMMLRFHHAPKLQPIESKDGIFYIQSVARNEPPITLEDFKKQWVWEGGHHGIQINKFDNLSFVSREFNLLGILFAWIDYHHIRLSDFYQLVKEKITTSKRHKDFDDFFSLFLFAILCREQKEIQKLENRLKKEFNSNSDDFRTYKMPYKLFMNARASFLDLAVTHGYALDFIFDTYLRSNDTPFLEKLFTYPYYPLIVKKEDDTANSNTNSLFQTVNGKVREFDLTRYSVSSLQEILDSAIHSASVQTLSTLLDAVISKNPKSAKLAEILKQLIKAAIKHQPTVSLFNNISNTRKEEIVIYLMDAALKIFPLKQEAAAESTGEILPDQDVGVLSEETLSVYITAVGAADRVSLLKLILDNVHEKAWHNFNFLVAIVQNHDNAWIIADYFHKYAISPEVADLQGNTLLGYAGRVFNFKMCELLISYGFKPEKENIYGEIPLYFLAENIIIKSRATEDRIFKTWLVLSEFQDGKNKRLECVDKLLNAWMYHKKTCYGIKTNPLKSHYHYAPFYKFKKVEKKLINENAFNLIENIIRQIYFPGCSSKLEMQLLLNILLKAVLEDKDFLKLFSDFLNKVKNIADIQGDIYLLDVMVESADWSEAWNKNEIDHFFAVASLLISHGADPFVTKLNDESSFFEEVRKRGAECAPNLVNKLNSYSGSMLATPVNPSELDCLKNLNIDLPFSPEVQELNLDIYGLFGSSPPNSEIPSNFTNQTDKRRKTQS